MEATTEVSESTADIMSGYMDDGYPYVPGLNCGNCGRFVGRDGSIEIGHFEMSDEVAYVSGTCRRCCQLEAEAERFNDVYPAGTPVRYWSGRREGVGVESKTRTPAWAIPSGSVLVSVEGYAGGIALSHVEPIK
jgi:hypothetical protein